MDLRRSVALPKATRCEECQVPLAAVDGLLVRYGRDSGAFYFVSHRSEALTGYAVAELLWGDGATGAVAGIAHDQLILPDERERVRAEIAAVGEGERYRVRYSLRRRDGSVHRVRESGVVLRAEKSRSRHQRAAAQRTVTADGVALPPADEWLVEALIEDDSEQVASERRRDDAEWRFRSMFENLVVGMFRTTRDGRYLAANQALAKLYGYASPSALVASLRNIAERLYVDPARREEFARLIREEGRVIDFVSEVYRADGTRIWIAENAHAVHDAAGDTLIIRMAQRLREALRAIDTVARYGGDEFVLVLAEHSGLHHTMGTLERVQRAISEPLFIDGRELRVNCSIGVSLYPENGDDIGTLLRHANAAMHHAKALGKGQFQFFTREMNTAAHQRLALDSALRRAQEANELSVAYQPKIDPYGVPCGFEALMRWNSAELGPISPERFIPLAEETGLIESMTDFVLRRACQEAVSWPLPVSVAVNLSPRLFRDPHLAARVEAILAETGLPAARLELEITESALLGDLSQTMTIIESLRALGARIALDDFGTGYSSLTYLRRLPIDIVKIDRSFVTDCEQGGEAMAIPRSIIALGRCLHLRIVAEGVENPRQLEQLAAYGCDEFQGFLIAKPLSPEDARAFLEGKRVG
ncbi:putative bifunctional diguanylate cyclase/phosphodiesterase [Rhodocyclus gracilis]|uniref:putative bifunctional diguanylate cyclase/phosphodiesterase n=1 Tax=Rhodocyclus gracilis TaxID=2929842 RepID=UPI00188FC11B|nr:EAL domain-containing protein [Rhodocyclus gracilis]